MKRGLFTSRLSPPVRRGGGQLGGLEGGWVAQATSHAPHPSPARDNPGARCFLSSYSLHPLPIKPLEHKCYRARAGGGAVRHGNQLFIAPSVLTTQRVSGIQQGSEPGLWVGSSRRLPRSTQAS